MIESQVGKISESYETEQPSVQPDAQPVDSPDSVVLASFLYARCLSMDLTCPWNSISSCIGRFLFLQSVASNE